MMFRRINFHSIPVRDQSRALAFYRDKLGFQVQTDAPHEEGWRWIFLQIPGSQTLLNFAPPGYIQVKQGAALFLVTDDVDAEAERLRSVGITMTEGPTGAEWHPAVRWAMFADSEGNMIMMQSSTMEP